MCPDPIRRKGRKTLAKVYDSLSGLFMFNGFKTG